MAKSLINCIGIKKNKPEAFIPAIMTVKRGIITRIPFYIRTEELLEKIRIDNPSLHITGTKRL
jgi:hypothetical protein